MPRTVPGTVLNAHLLDEWMKSWWYTHLGSVFTECGLSLNIDKTESLLFGNLQWKGEASMSTTKRHMRVKGRLSLVDIVKVLWETKEKTTDTWADLEAEEDFNRKRENIPGWGKNVNKSLWMKSCDCFTNFINSLQFAPIYLGPFYIQSILFPGYNLWLTPFAP